MVKPLPFAPSLAATKLIVKGESIPFGKEWGRCLISGDRLLSVPMEGGASLFKRKNIDFEQFVISDHGRWRQEHLGAWNAVYGKTPFFPYIFPKIEEAYKNDSHGTLAEFNASLFDIFIKFLDLRSLETSLDILKKENPERLELLSKEYETKVNINYSIFDTLFRFGKNTLWALI